MKGQSWRKWLAIWGVLAALGVVSADGVAADTNVVPDLTIEVASRPGTVSPPGGLVIYEITVRNASAVDAAGTFFTGFKVTGTLPAGFTYKREFSSASCAPSVATCSGPALAAGESAILRIAAATDPTATGTFTMVASISGSDPIVEDARNNTASTTTTVTNDGTKGYFPPGNYTVGSHVLTVPSPDPAAGDSTPGVIGELSVQGRTSSFCLIQGCKFGEAVRAAFDSNPEFQVTDRNRPLKLSLNLNQTDPCRGIGSGSGCADLRALKEDGTRISPVPQCVGPAGTIGGPNDPSPCISELSKTQTGGYHFGVLLLSNDPTFF